MNVADLSKAELLRLVEVLQITHPQAVNSALALIQPAAVASVPSNNSKSDGEDGPAAAVDGGEVSVVKEEVQENKIALVEEEEEEAFNSNEPERVDPAPSQQQTSTIIEKESVVDDEPASAPLQPINLTGESAMLGEEIEAEPVAAKGEVEESAALQDEQQPLPNTASNPEVVEPSPGSTGNIIVPQSPSVVEEDVPLTSNTINDPSSSSKEEGEEIVAQTVVSDTTTTTTVAPPPPAQEKQQTKKKKKRPPGKRRASKTTAAPTEEMTEKEPVLQPSSSLDLQQPMAVTTEPAVAKPTVDAPASATPLTVVGGDATPVESGSCSVEEIAHATESVVAEEKVNDLADEKGPVTINIQAELPPPPVEQPQDTAASVAVAPKIIETPAPVIASVPVTPENTAPPAPISIEAPKVDEQQEESVGAVSPSTTSAPAKKTKKRPPGKRRTSTAESIETDSTSQSPSSAAAVPVLVNESSAAMGTIEHEVIPWQADPADTVDKDDSELFFDGHSITARYQDVSANKSPEAAGCYLLFDPQGGGKMVLHYSKTRIAQALGFYAPGPDYSIQGFKFTKNHGRVELIGNCASGKAGRNNYYAGWCQFIRAAKDVNGSLFVYSRTEGQPGLDVDVYVYLRSRPPTVTSVQLPENRPCCVSEIVAVACLPANAEFFPDVRVDESKWMGDGNALGTSIQLDDDRKPVPTTEGLFIPGVSAPSAPKQLESTLDEGPEEDYGCYLVYDADGSKLIEHYSKTKIAGAIGFFSPGPGQTIPGFKFKSKQGRNELIGNCSSGGVTGRKNYYSGWCQFIRAAKAMNGSVWISPEADDKAGLAFDVYVYTMNTEAGGQQTTKLKENTKYDLSRICAVACLPKHVEFFDGLTMDLTRWVEEGRNIGASLQA